MFGQLRRLCAYALIFAASTAAGQHAPIDITEAPSTNPPSPPADRMQGRSTTTYVRCHYRNDSGIAATSTQYQWALTPTGDWYEIPGYWYSGPTLGANMFYTNVPATDLKAACEDTLRQHDILADIVMVAASNTALSPFNYTIWHQGEARTHAFERMVVFGDSLSDTQNIYSLTLHAAPAKGSWFLGRFSNGPVWTEYLAKAADLPLYTWAVGSAGTDQHLILPGFPQQVDSWRSYMTAAEHYDPSGTLFLALFGGNDFINYDVTPAAALEAVTRGIDKLLAAGATRIVIGNLPDVTRAPIFKWRDDAVTVAAKVRQYNAGLASLVAQRHDSRLTLFDAAAFFDTILRSPGTFGFTDIDTSCLRMDTSSLWAYRAEQQRRPGCDPEHFIFWDTLHPTSRLHQLMGEAALKAIPELSQY